MKKEKEKRKKEKREKKKEKRKKRKEKIEKKKKEKRKEKREKKKEKRKKKKEKREKRKENMFAVFSALCPARNFRSRSNQTMGCAHIDVIVLKAMCNVQLWHVDGVWLKHSSS